MIVILIGPIKHWWTCWNTPAHREYVEHRESVNDALLEDGHLVYRPHEAFKGSWDEWAQRVNDVAIEAADVVINLTPNETPSDGTKEELRTAQRLNKLVIACPPGVSTEALLASLGVVPHREALTSP